jgi:hypothetical protein
MGKQVKALLIGLALFSATVSASEFCNNLADASSSIMKVRQKGVPMQKLMEVINRNEAKDIMTIIAIEAYESPIYSSEKYKKQAASELSNEVYLACLKGEK